MEDINHKDTGDNEMDNNNITDENSDIEEYDRDGQLPVLDENTFERLKKNDSSVTHLRMFLSNDWFFKSIDWKEDGDCISDNIHLKKLHICYNKDSPNYVLVNKDRQQLQDFFFCLYQNCSIKVIIIDSGLIEVGESFIEGLGGHPSLIRLEINNYLGSLACEVLGKILKHPSKLKDLRLSHLQLDDDSRIDLLFDALLGNSTMTRLSVCFYGNKDIDFIGWQQGLIPGWQSLSAVLQHPSCKLTKLSLTSAGLNDESADILGSALRGSSVKDLDLSLNSSISKSGWQTLLNQLAHTSIKSLHIGSSQIDDAVLATLANITTLKCLDLYSSSTPAGWRSFFNTLQRRDIKLAELIISGNNIGSEGTDALSDLISNMGTLKTLTMMEMGREAEVTWVSFFNALQESNLDLVELNLDDSRIDDEGIQLLVPLVSSMSSLKLLTLGYNRSVSSVGWQALSAFLHSPNFALEELDLHQNNIDDDTVIAFTRALVHNKTLKLLDLYQDPQDFDDDDNLITKRGWEAISTLLCNKTSIMDTYNSNHTLQDLTDDPILYDDDMKTKLPSDLDSSIELNKNKDKVEVARQKILQTHFSTEDEATSKIQELLDMELEMMSSVIAWIGRPASASAYWRGVNVSGLSLMYNLMKRLPDLFDSDVHKKKPSGAGKRKRDV